MNKMVERSSLLSPSPGAPPCFSDAAHLIVDGGTNPIQLALCFGEGAITERFAAPVEELLPTFLTLIAPKLRGKTWRCIWLRGPGSFTGLRLTAMWAQALQSLHDIPILSLGHLEVAASRVEGEGPLEIFSWMRSGDSLTLSRYQRDAEGRLHLSPPLEGIARRALWTDWEQWFREEQAISLKQAPSRAMVAIDWSRRERLPLTLPILWIQEQDEAWMRAVLKQAEQRWPEAANSHDFEPDYELEPKSWQKRGTLEPCPSLQS